MENAGSDHVRVILRGSLGKTGRGHLSDRAVREALAPLPCEILFDDSDADELPHPNTMDFTAYKNGAETASMRVLSTAAGPYPSLAVRTRKRRKYTRNPLSAKSPTTAKRTTGGSGSMWRSARERISGIIYLKSGM
jgi:hypothetical protein